MAQLFEYLKMAIWNIKSNKGRSILTMLGIIIGISSVILIISVGDGAKGKISNELNGIGAGQIYIYMNTREGQSTDTITRADMDAIKEKIENVKGVTPQLGAWGSILGSKGNFDLSVTAGTQDLEYTSDKKVIRGRYFSEADLYGLKKVCVISQTDAIHLFGTDDVVGMTVEATVYNRTVDLTIVGVREVDKDSLINVSYNGDAIALEMPYLSYEACFGQTINGFESLYIISESSQYSKTISKATVHLLESRHRNKGEDAFLVSDFNDYLKQINQVLGTMTTFVVLVAAISLLVGGVGVMNIMLVSVTERTREIGIRKALGARTGSVMLQFLSESAIITLFGGIIGIALGLGGAYAICSIPALGFQPVISITTILITTLFSSFVGIFFGIYPARKAAKLRPIEALRRN